MEKTLLLIANIISFVGMSIATVAALFKDKRRVLLLQSANHVLEIVAQGMIKAYSGMVQEVITLLYSVILLFVKGSRKVLKITVSSICLAAGLAIGIVVNVLFSGNVWYGYLPIAAAAIYTAFVIVAFCRDEKSAKGDFLLKIGLMINTACWSAYCWFVGLYVAMGFNAAAFLFAAISFGRMLYDRRAGKQSPVEESAEKAD